MFSSNPGSEPLFVFATEMELSKVFPEIRVEGLKQNELISLGICNKGFACILGVGLLNFSLNLSKILFNCERDNVKISAVVNVGICGAYPGRNCKVLDIVRVKSDCVGDFGFEKANGDCSHWIERYGESTDELVPECIKDYFKKLPIVSGATVNCCSGTLATAMARLHALDCDVESMEGAACFAVCDQFHIPAFQIRAVSNMASVRDKSQWKVAEALEKLWQFFHK